MDKASYGAKLAGVRVESGNVKSFSFTVSGDYDYVAGQFAFLEFVYSAKRYVKYFSLSSSPTRINPEFTTIISSSEYKQALNKLRIGSRVKLSEPMGVFTLDSRVTDKIVYLAGGIGITPVRSMLQYLMDTGNPEISEIMLFYSNRNMNRIIFREELDELNTRLDNLGVVHTLTEAGVDGEKTWDGETGFINSEMIKKHLTNPVEWCFYVVGPPSFNKAMGYMLTRDLGLVGDNIITEDFTGY